MFRATDSAKIPIAVALLLTAGCTVGPDFLSCLLYTSDAADE